MERLELYKTKPSLVKAIRLSETNIDYIFKVFDLDMTKFTYSYDTDKICTGLKIKIKNKYSIVHLGDWIVIKNNKVSVYDDTSFKSKFTSI